MLKGFFQQLWFILLMVFSITCGTLSVASAKTMHLSVQSSSSQAPCHAQMPHHSMAHMQKTPQKKAQDHLTSNTHCETQTNHPADCLDCHFSACQSMMTWLNFDAPDFEQSPLLELHSSPILPFHARHLSGYWQEILRPPQA